MCSSDLDQLVYQSEKTLEEMGDKVEAADKQTIEDAVAKVKTTLSGTDVEAIKLATDELQKAFYAVSEKLYSQANPQDAAGQNPGGGQNPEGEFYDADYEVVDDDKQE